LSSQSPHFSPKQVAEALGSSESSLKRWCDQGAIPTIRTVGGHRRITLEGLTKFLESSGRVLMVPDVLGVSLGQIPRMSEIPDAGSEECSEFRRALARGDDVACMRILQTSIDRGISCGQSAGRFISDAMCGIGQGWEQSTIEPYEERRAVNICTRLIEELRRQLPAIDRNAPVAIGGTPPGDHYQLATSVVELTLRELGWNATNLGCNLPWATLRQAVLDYRPRMLWLSISEIVDANEFIAEHNRLYHSISKEVAVIVGGRALTDKIRPQLLFTAHCDQLGQFVELSNILKSR
jgi:MerR family transcriptional regulator, light-induced transcriptional regulator